VVTIVKRMKTAVMLATLFLGLTAEIDAQTVAEAEAAQEVPVAVQAPLEPLAGDPGDSDATSVDGAEPAEEVSAIADPVPLQDFRIGVSDSLSISIWKNKELNARVPVAPDGMISLPLVGDVLAAGRKPAEVRADLKERYEEFLTAPEVSLVVTGINSRVIYIIGEVGKQGVHELLLPTTILQALAKAGGLSNYAKKDRIVVLRRVGDAEQYITLSVKGVENGKHLEDNILLKPGDTIIVP